MNLTRFLTTLFASNRFHQPCADRRHGHRIDISKHHLPQRRPETD